MIVSVVEGSGRINNMHIKKGDHFIIPAGYGTSEFKGDGIDLFHVPCTTEKIDIISISLIFFCTLMIKYDKI